MRIVRFVVLILVNQINTLQKVTLGGLKKLNVRTTIFAVMSKMKTLKYTTIRLIYSGKKRKQFLPKGHRMDFSAYSLIFPNSIFNFIYKV